MSTMAPATPVTHQEAQAAAALEFLKKFGRATPASLDEAIWLSDRVAALKAASGLDVKTTLPNGQVVTLSPTPSSRSLTPLVLIGAAGAAGIAFVALRAGRRKNPRASRWTPVLAVSGAIAGLWWLGRRAVAQVREVIPASAEPPPLEGAFD